MGEVNAMNGDNGRLPTAVKVGYGAPQFGEFVGITMFAMWSMFFFTDVAGLSAAFAGIISGLSTVWDGLIDPQIGMWTDNRDPKKGRRRPFLLASAILFPVILWLLYTDFNLGPFWSMVYFTLLLFMHKTTHALLDIPYTALGAEITKNYDERSSLNSIRNFFGAIGALMTASTMLLAVAWFGGIFGGERAGWSATVAVFALLSAISIHHGWRTTRGYEQKTVTTRERVRYRDYIDVLKNRSFRYITAMFAVSNIAFALSNVVAVYWLVYTLEMSDEKISLLMLVFWVASMFWVPVLNWLSHRFTKKLAWNLAMLVWACSCIVFPLMIITGPGPSTFTWLLVFVVFLQMGQTAQFQCSWAMIPDSVEVDEFETGRRREGVYYACVSFIQKFAMAIAYLIGGFMLTWVGYDPSVELSSETLTGIAYLFALGQSIPLLITYLIGLFYPVNRDNHSALRRALELKKRGEPFSDDGFRNLLSKEYRAAHLPGTGGTDA